MFKVLVSVLVCFYMRIAIPKIPAIYWAKPEVGYQLFENLWEERAFYQ